MYNLYLDKSELFEAKVNVKGAKLSDSFCRLVLLSEDWNLVFEGEVDSSGFVKVPIKKLKNVLSEGQQGSLKLEVIVEDTYFVPWHDTFEVIVGKQVTAEVVSKKKNTIQEGKPSMKATLIKSTSCTKGRNSTNVTEALHKVIGRKYPTLNESSRNRLVNNIKKYLDGKQSRK